MPQYGPPAVPPTFVAVNPDGFVEPTPGAARFKFEVTNASGEKTWKVSIKDPSDNEIRTFEFLTS